MTCKGDSAVKCGGPNQYNFYVATSVTSGLVGTSSGAWSSVPATSTP